MFQALQTLLASLASLTFSLVANADGTLTVTVIPKSGKGSGLLDTPLTLTGTPVELDEGFAETLYLYRNKRQSLGDQLAATEAILEAAQKEASDKAKKSIANKPTKKSSAPSAENSEEDDDGQGGNDELGTSSAAPASAEPSSTATTPAAGTSASDLWG